MELYDNKHNVYFKEESLNGNTCPSVAILYFKSFRDINAAAGTCVAPTKMLEMDDFDRSMETLFAVLHIQCTILPTLFWFALARLLTQVLPTKFQNNACLIFLIEFIVITVPTIICINGANDKVEVLLAIIVFLVLYFVWQTGCLQRAKERIFYIGKRPRMLTLGRAAINFLTAFCILAIDFETFPKRFRKSRRYGAGLMDTGIGLFVFAMGSVSKRSQRAEDMKRMLRIVLPLLVLGFLRTIIIESIGYSQDQHEYGQHLNAFFTLGLTKLFGTLASVIATRSTHLLTLGWGILCMHEFTLQWGLAAYVMDDSVARNNFIDANREGLVSLPGFIGIFVLSMFLGELWQTSELPLKWKEFRGKIIVMFVICAVLWSLIGAAVFSVGIARVTCNFGYAVWTLFIAASMIFLFMLIFDLILETLWPVEQHYSLASSSDGVEAAYLLNTEKCITRTASTNFGLPALVNAVNMNGLVFFLVANILTGGVNIFIGTDDRSSFESYFILFVYMFLSVGLVFVLYHRKIRIG